MNIEPDKIIVNVDGTIFRFDGGKISVESGILYLYESSPAYPFAVFKSFNYVIQKSPFNGSHTS